MATSGKSTNSGASISIGTANFNAPSQIGNHNIQNIEATFQSLVQQIDASSASPEEKQEAKGRLLKFLESSATCAAIGGAVGPLIEWLRACISR